MRNSSLRILAASSRRAWLARCHTAPERRGAAAAAAHQQHAAANAAQMELADDWWC
jgi:hypothetical protein